MANPFDFDLEAHNERMLALAFEQWKAKTPEDPMPNVSEMIVSKFLQKADFPQPMIATIRDVSLERFNARDDSDRDSAWILWFNELPKGLKLNTTNIRVLEAAFGQHSDLWRGRRVKIYVDMSIMMAGKVVGGLRLQPPSAPVIMAGASPAQAPPVGARFDPMTGLPLAAPAPSGARFDPMTGQPLTGPAQTPAAAVAREPGGDDEFNDEIPF